MNTALSNQQTMPLAYVYDGTLEGLLCAIFDTYARKESPLDVCTPQNLQLRLGQSLHEVKTDLDHATRVRNGLIKICGPSVYDAIRTASLSDNPQTGTTCVNFARYAMQKNKQRWKNPKARFYDATMAIAEPEVQPLHALQRNVSNEREYIVQFLRFEELEGDVWFARCNPKASVVPILMDYFAARFNTQAFIIYDEVHGLAGVYEGGLPERAKLDTKSARRATAPSISAGQTALALPDDASQTAARMHSKAKHPRWYLVKSDVLEVPERTENEALMRDAWKRFYRALSINDRYHLELRRQQMPMRFWGNMTEFQYD